MIDRIPLDHLTSDQYDALCERLEQAERAANLELQRRLEAAIAALGKSETELAALRQVARGYCPSCGRGDAAPGVEHWERQKRRADQAEELLQIAHETANTSETERAHAVQRADDAEEFARQALTQRQEMAAERHVWQERGDRAEATLTRIADYLNSPDGPCCDRVRRTLRNILGKDHP